MYLPSSAMFYSKKNDFLISKNWSVQRIQKNIFLPLTYSLTTCVRHRKLSVQNYKSEFIYIFTSMEFVNSMDMVRYFIVFFFFLLFVPHWLPGCQSVEYELCGVMWNWYWRITTHFEHTQVYEYAWFIVDKSTCLNKKKTTTTTT